MEISILNVIRNSATMMALLAMSVMVFTIVLERFWYLRRCSTNTVRFMAQIKHYVMNKSFAEAIKLCEQKDKPLNNVIKIGLNNRNLPKEDIEDLMTSTRMEEKTKMEKFLLFLGSMGAIGPLMGLLGTVTGLSRAFKDLALSGSAGPSVVAAGISEALYATVAGLGIAIPTVLLYNYLMGRARKINTEIDVSSKRLLVWLFSQNEAKQGQPASQGIR